MDIQIFFMFFWARGLTIFLHPAQTLLGGGLATLVWRSLDLCDLVFLGLGLVSFLFLLSPPASDFSGSSWQEQLLPLVVTFRDCVREVVGRVRTAVMFVLLQRSFPSTAPGGFTERVQRRHAVFSQAVRLNCV